MLQTLFRGWTEERPGWKQRSPLGGSGNNPGRGESGLDPGGTLGVGRSQGCLSVCTLKVAPTGLGGGLVVG